MSGIPQFCVAATRLSAAGSTPSSNVPTHSEKHSKSIRKCSYGGNQGVRGGTGSTKASIPYQAQGGSNAQAQSAKNGPISPNPVTPGRSMMEKFQLFRSKNKSKQESKCSSSSSGFSSARSEKSDSSIEAQQSKRIEVSTGSSQPLDLKAYRQKVSKLTSHRPDPSSRMSIHMSKEASCSTKSQSIESLALSGGTGPMKRESKSLNTNSLQHSMGGSSGLGESISNVLRAKSSKVVSHPNSSSVSSGSKNRYSASGIPTRHSNHDEQKVMPLNKVTGIPKPTAAVKGTSKLSAQEDACLGSSGGGTPGSTNEGLYTNAFYGSNLRGLQNAEKKIIHSSSPGSSGGSSGGDKNSYLHRRSKDHVALVSPMFSPAAGASCSNSNGSLAACHKDAEDLVKESQNSIKHSAEALADVSSEMKAASNKAQNKMIGGSSGKLRGDDEGKRRGVENSTPGTGNDEEEEDLALLNVKPMEPLKRNSPYKYMKSPHMTHNRFNGSPVPMKSPSHSSVNYHPYCVTSAINKNGGTLKEEVWLCDPVKPSPNEEDSTKHKGSQPPPPLPMRTGNVLKNGFVNQNPLDMHSGGKPIVNELFRTVLSSDEGHGCGRTLPQSGMGGGRRKVKISGGTQTTAKDLEVECMDYVANSKACSNGAPSIVSDSEVELFVRGGNKFRNSCNLNWLSKSRQQLHLQQHLQSHHNYQVDSNYPSSTAQRNVTQPRYSYRNGDHKSLSLTGSIASQLSEGLREKILSSQSLPKWCFVNTPNGVSQASNHPEGNNGTKSDVASDAGEPAVWISYNNVHSSNQQNPQFGNNGDDIYSFLGMGYASSVMTEPLRSDGDRGSSLSLVSTTLSSYSGYKDMATKESKTAGFHELKRLRRELKEYKDKMKALSSQLDCSERECTELRKEAENLRNLCLDAGITTTYIASYLQSQSEASQSMTPRKKSEVTALPASHLKSNESKLLGRQVSTDSISSEKTSASGASAVLNSPSSKHDQSIIGSPSSKKKHSKHKGWLRSSFTKAFTKKASSKGEEVDGGTQDSSSPPPYPSYSIQAEPCDYSVNDCDLTFPLSSTENKVQVGEQGPISNSTSNSRLYEELSVHNTDLKKQEDLILDLRRQLREKEMVLTDTRLEALNSAQQVDFLKESMTEIQYKVKLLEDAKEKLEEWKTNCICSKDTDFTEQTEVMEGQNKVNSNGNHPIGAETELAYHNERNETN